MSSCPASMTSDELATVNARKRMNPPRCLSAEGESSAQIREREGKREELPVRRRRAAAADNYVQTLSVSLCQEKTLRTASRRGHSER